jgi:hypothetical protein
MCHATGAKSEFWLECLVRTNRTSCIMLKVVEEPKTKLMTVSVLSRIVIVCFVLSSLSSLDVLLCINFIRVVA